jgi:ankyrin repeat protein
MAFPLAVIRIISLCAFSLIFMLKSMEPEINLVPVPPDIAQVLEQELESTGFYEPEDIDEYLKTERWSPLHIAAFRGDLNEIRKLLSEHVDINQKTPTARPGRGETALHLAIGQAHADAALLLIDAGANINIPDEAGDTPLHVAAVNNLPTVIQVLLDRGADINAKDQDGDTPLHRAAADDSLEAINLLIRRGAAVNGTNRFGETPLHIAAMYGNTEAIRSLLAAGANVNALSAGRLNLQGFTPLHYAAANGQTAAVRALLNAGAQINAITSERYVPLSYAIYYTSPPREHGGTVVIKNPFVEHTATQGHVNTILTLIMYGATLDPRYIPRLQKIVPPLYLAAALGNLDELRKLLASGTIPSAQLDEALSFAVGNLRPDAVRVLLEAGANPALALTFITRLAPIRHFITPQVASRFQQIMKELRAAEQARPPIVLPAPQYAEAESYAQFLPRELQQSLIEYATGGAEARKLATQELLTAINNRDSKAMAQALQNGADPNAVDANGLTPLWHAVFDQDPHWALEAVSLLLRYHAAPNPVNTQGVSLLQAIQQLPESQRSAFARGDRAVLLVFLLRDYRQQTGNRIPGLEALLPPGVFAATNASDLRKLLGSESQK